MTRIVKINMNECTSPACVQKFNLRSRRTKRYSCISVVAETVHYSIRWSHERKSYEREEKLRQRYGAHPARSDAHVDAYAQVKSLPPARLGVFSPRVRLLSSSFLERIFPPLSRYLCVRWSAPAPPYPSRSSPLVRGAYIFQRRSVAPRAVPESLPI